MSATDPMAGIAPGMRGEARTVVTHDLTVQHTQPHMPAVYGTPYMIYLMEVAAAGAFAAVLPPGWVSVGVGVNIEHLAATPMGRTVTATAVVSAVRDRLVVLDVEAHDGVRLIGKGVHTRAPIDMERFLRRLQAEV